MRGFCVAGACALLSGCIALPEYDVHFQGVTTGDIVKHILCETQRAVAAYPTLNTWQATVSLTLQVQDSGGVSPTLAYIPAPTLSLASTGSFTHGTTRSYSESFPFKLNEIGNIDCSGEMEKLAGAPLTGSLNIVETVAMAAESASRLGPGYDLNKLYGAKSSKPAEARPSHPPSISKIPALDSFSALSLPLTSQASGGGPSSPGTGGGTGGGGKDKLAAGKENTFGETVVFTLSMGLSATGPSWTFTTFKGPGGLLSASRQNTDTMSITFAPGNADPASVSRAAKDQQFFSLGVVRVD